MKRIIFIALIGLFLVGICTAQSKIRITNGDWEPFLSETLPNHGLYSHIVEEAFKLEGITVEWGFFPWARSYDLAKDGEDWSASAVWWPSDDAKTNFYISDSVGETSFVFFHLKTFKFDWKTFNDLKGRKIGGTREYAYGSEFDAAKNKRIFSFDESSTDEDNFKKLLKGRIELFPNDPIVGYAQIRNNFSSEDAQKFTHHKKEFEVTTLSLLISKNDPNALYFLEKFNSGLKKLKASGRYANMFKDLENGKYD